MPLSRVPSSGITSTLQISALQLPSSGSFVIKDASGVDDYFSINSSGRVTTPYQSAFRARSNGGTFSADTTINYQNVYLNIGGNYNSANSTFTAPVAGMYMFGGMTRIDSNQSYVYTELYINGTRLYAATGELSGLTTTGFSGFTAGSFNIIISLSANDSVKCGFGTSSSSVTIDAQTHWYGYLIG